VTRRWRERERGDGGEYWTGKKRKGGREETEPAKQF